MNLNIFFLRQEFFREVFINLFYLLKMFSVLLLFLNVIGSMPVCRKFPFQAAVYLSKHFSHLSLVIISSFLACTLMICFVLYLHLRKMQTLVSVDAKHTWPTPCWSVTFSWTCKARHWGTGWWAWLLLQYLLHTGAYVPPRDTMYSLLTPT